MSIRKPFSHGIQTGAVTESSFDMNNTSVLITTMSDIKPNHFLSYIMSIRKPFSHGIQTGAVRVII